MKERTIDCEIAIPTDDQASVVCEPGEGALDLPTPPVSPEFAPVVESPSPSVLSIRTDQLDASTLQPYAQGVAVVPFVRDQAFRIFPRSAAPCPRDGDPVERLLQKRYFCRGGRVQVVSDRNTLAVDHHHPLRTLSTFGLSDTVAPFFAGANDPSAKVSAQSSWPFSSNSAKKALQISSQTPCSSQSRSLRQQVLGDGYCAGRSFQRAPLRSTQRMPSKHRRLSIRFRPPFGDLRTRGNNGSIFAHWASVNSGLCRAMEFAPFHGTHITQTYEN